CSDPVGLRSRKRIGRRIRACGASSQAHLSRKSSRATFWLIGAKRLRMELDPFIGHRYVLSRLSCLLGLRRKFCKELGGPARSLSAVPQTNDVFGVRL